MTARFRGADSGEMREPVSDIETVAVDSLKVLDPAGRLEKRTSVLLELDTNMSRCQRFP
jgi:hypothetical protein